MLRNLMDKIYQVALLVAQTVTATGNSSSIDLKDLMSCTFLLNVGNFAFDGSNYLTLAVQESDDNSTWSEATVANGGLYEAAPVLDAGGDANKSHAIEYRGTKRYARLAWTETGTVSVPLSVTAIGLSKVQPPA